MGARILVCDDEDALREMLGVLLRRAGYEVVSAGGTGTYDINHAATEIQAGSYLFMDTHYAAVGLPFVEALSVLATVVSVDPNGGWAVADAGLKAVAMDHGNPRPDKGSVFFCSDEHTTLIDDSWRVGDQVRHCTLQKVGGRQKVGIKDGDEFALGLF